MSTRFNIERPRVGSAARFVGIFVGVAMLCSCGDSGSTGGTGGAGGGSQSVTRAEVLSALAQNVIEPTYISFEEKVNALELALRNAAADPSNAALTQTAQQAWREAIAVWQRAEVMQIGPAADADAAMGGLDLRDAIYSWDNLNRCVLNQATVGDDVSDPDAIDGPKGLWAIEYLLFSESTDNTCPPASTINTDGTWTNALPQLASLRLLHAATIGVLLQRDARELGAQWANDDGNFIAELTEPARSGALYGSAQEGLNAISDAMHYLDTETKDMKLATPAGETAECAAMQCPELVESRWAKESTSHVVENLRGFRLLLTGGEGDALGFDDLLVDLGADAVATDLRTALDDAIASVESIGAPIQDAVVSNLEAVRDARAAVKAATDVFKNAFLTDLDLEVPDGIPTDSD